MMTFRLQLLFFACLVSCTSHLLFGQTASTDIRLNQVGFLPGAPKIAIVKGTSATSFTIQSPDLTNIYYTGDLGAPKTWTPSAESVSVADFTAFTAPGTYVLVVDGSLVSFPFKIDRNYITGVNKAAIKAYYYQRASLALPAEFAGKWARAMGHPDTAVFVLPSAAGTNRPANTKISTPRGWYDAGDYNKYIVNSGISTYTLLASYEQYATYFDTLFHNIPESKNTLPDIIDECLWNVRWMLTMQDPNDGGVYNKTTNYGFDGLDVKPEQAKARRYVVAKGTAATLDFCAVMAQMSRIAAKFSTQLPGLSDSCLQASKYAWQWAIAHPSVAFNNPIAQDTFKAVATGGYGDTDFSDEKEWAAAELYITTKDPAYYALTNVKTAKYGIPTWGTVRSLGLMSLAFHRKQLTAEADTTGIKNALIKIVSALKDGQQTSAYRVPDFTIDWGSNSFIANTGMLLLNANQITGDHAYYNAALSCLDYILGRNATTYCFVTGLGSKPTMHPHHRVSISDGVDDPVPGWMAGGPQNKVGGDGCSSTGRQPATTYNDADGCYTTNEIAINWNAPLVFLSGGLNATRSPENVSANQTPEADLNFFSVQPNPSATQFNCKIYSASENSMTLRILDMNGREIEHIENLFTNSDFSMGEDLNPGIYVVHVSVGNKMISKKIVKTN